jgi:hypothetical protein
MDKEGEKEQTESAHDQLASELPQGVTAEQMRKAAALVGNANRIVVFSGAGISAESAYSPPLGASNRTQAIFLLRVAGGISTFRDPEMGLWTSKIGLAWFGMLFTITNDNIIIIFYKCSEHIVCVAWYQVRRSDGGGRPE